MRSKFSYFKLLAKEEIKEINFFDKMFAKSRNDMPDLYVPPLSR
jgi:hypothetical protein